MNHSPNMYWRSLLFSLLLIATTTGISQSIKVSEDAQFSIMTLGPYQGELYSAFGHSAIHFSDPANGIDWVYNYGVFDFDQENFFVNFALGKMLYKLGLSKYAPFRNHYIKQDRFITEQLLNLTQAENQALYDFLDNNRKPENRDYYYNYVYDNCATKMYDVLEGVFPERITFDLNYIEEEKTIRDLMDDYLDYQPWGDWIIDIGLGLQIDKKATAKEYMFLPDYIERAFANATIQKGSVTVPLVADRVEVYKSKNEKREQSMFTPFNFFVILFFVVGWFTNRDFKRRKRTRWIDPILFTIAGILGWWVAFLWLGTVHLSQNNLNILWAIPLHVPFAYLINVKKLQPFLSKYFLLVSILYCVLILTWALLPQPLHMALIPLILTMILRGFYVHFDLQKEIKKSTLS